MSIERHMLPASRRLAAFCRTLPGVTEDVKWIDNLVFSVGGKMFAMFDLEGRFLVAFKCSEEEFDRLTRRRGIIPAPYAARFFWVNVRSPRALTPAQAKGLLSRAHAVVLARLPRRARERITPRPEGRVAPARRARIRPTSRSSR